MLHNFFNRRVIVSRIQSIDRLIILTLIDAKTALVLIAALHVTEHYWGWLLDVDRRTLFRLHKILMVVMVMMALHVLVCEPVQIDIVEFLEPDEDVWVPYENIKTEDDWQVESCD